jgi:2-keto-4-pentenoate hydratase/2-oxohepta-3-ene-1,7-dioic acid hydratase in catechol pathway
MKLATFHHQGHTAVGLVDADNTTLWPLDDLLGRPAGDMNQIIRDFAEISSRLVPSGAGLPLSSVRLAAPIPRPLRNVFCVGKNYFDHAHEFSKSGFDSSTGPQGSAVPEAPIIFTKPPETVIADGEAVRYPAGVSDSLDYEAELAVVIGKGGRSISRDRAFDHVWGYTIINDVTARDWQARHKQWFLGKSMDTFCPMGPWLVTADAVDVTNSRVRCWVNGELRQDANTRDLIFDIPVLIETLSAGLTLQPGDIIATGTPAGVGIGFTPPRFLRPGDRVAIEIEGIGRLENPIV